MDSTLDDGGAPAAAAADGVASDDLSAIAWVQEELRRSLDAAHKSLRRFQRDSEAVSGSDLDAVDPGVLRGARAQIHQGTGALELVGLPAAATVLRASESAVQRAIGRPASLTPELVGDIERASFALLDYLSRLLAGKTVSPLALFPQYRAVQEAVEAERVHPADLWPMDWRWRDVAVSPDVVARHADTDTRAQLEGQLLQLMRGVQALTAASRMVDLCAGLAAGASHPQVRTFWSLAAAFFEAQHHGLLPFDIFTKRVASRLLPQFRLLQKGDTDVSERLARDVLFFCAQAAPAGRGVRAPALVAVRAAYGLPEQQPTDYSLSVLGRFDPAIVAHARKRVVAAKEAWSATAGGEMHRLAGLAEQVALVGDSLRKLLPFGEAFAAELQAAATQTQAAAAAPPTALAMEVATGLLFVEAALEDGDFDDPEHAARVRRLADRLSAVRRGGAPEALESWMEELYRRVSDRQTMGSVVHELRASLGEIEKAIDTFFRRPDDRTVLVDVPVKLGAMRGVLSVLGMGHAAQALLRMRDEVDGLAQTEVDPARIGSSGVFDRLAGNLSALGFLIDMLGVQPSLAKSLFTYDAETGALSPLMGRADPARPVPPEPPPVEPRLIEQAQLLAFTSVREDVPLDDVQRDLERLSQEAQAADQPALAATVLKAQEAIVTAHGDHAAIVTARGELSEALVDFVSTSTEPSGLEPVAVAEAPAIQKPIALVIDLEHDDEMRDIFLEEAREVIETARGATAGLAASPDDLGLLTTVRRAFHTLKGSSRMVGLKSFGEAAWSCEQIYNTQLADQRGGEPALLEFTTTTLDELSSWVEDIAEQRDGPRSERGIKLAADGLARRLKSGDDAAAFDLPVTEDVAAASLPPDLPSADDLDLRLSSSVAPATAPSAVDAPAEEVAFELDLSGFDAPDAATPSSGATTADGRQWPAFDPGGADGAASAMFDPFESRTDTVPGDSNFADLDLDLDLGDASDSRPFIEPLAPTVDIETSPGALDIETSPGALDEAAETQPAGEITFDTIDLALDDAPTDESTGEDSAPPAWPDEGPHEADREPPATKAEEAAAEPIVDENVKVVGPLRIGIPLFNIFLNEADELSRRLTTEVAEWGMELHRPVGEPAIALAHSLAGSSSAVGFSDLSHLSRTLEHAMARSNAIGHGTEDEARLFVDTAEDIRRLLHQFAAGFLRTPASGLAERLAEHEVTSARRLEAATAASELGEAVQDDETTTAVAVEPLIHLESEQAPLVAEPEGPASTALPSLAVSAASGDVEPAAPSAEDESEDATATESAPASAFVPLAPVGSLGLAELKPLETAPVDTPRTAVAARSVYGEFDGDIDAVDAVDLELFPIFEEEAEDLLPKLASELRDWAREPSAKAHAAACMRTLHTLKGGARLAGAMRLGEMAHRLETRIEHLTSGDASASAGDVDGLQMRADAMSHAFDALSRRDAQAYADAVAGAITPITPTAPVSKAAPTEPAAQPFAKPEPEATAKVDTSAAAAAAPAADRTPKPSGASPKGTAMPVKRAGRRAAARQAAAEGGADSGSGSQAAEESAPIDWSRFIHASPAAARATEPAQAVTQSSVRVRAPLLDRLVNQAGEVSITRSRIESGVGQIKGSLGDLTENLERLRGQLRDIELQGEVQMTSRLEAAKAASQSFDPLEFDRFTRFQELTRMMAESVNDVATVQRSLQRSVEAAEDELVAQARLTRDLQDDLLRTRMVEFEGLSDRLYRVVRLTAKETGKQVRLDIVGGSIEVDRGVLDRMTGAFEHLLRNSVAHGIEMPQVRTAAGKDATGTIVVSLSQEGNEVGVEVRDDGAGLDLARIRDKAVAVGLVKADASPDDAELANLIFTPGFTTVEKVTELAGRGVGMDVVRSEVAAMGGRIETATSSGRGTSFKLVMPLTTAVTQVVMLHAGEDTIAVPSTLVEIVRRAAAVDVDAAYRSGAYDYGGSPIPFFWLGDLLQRGGRAAETNSRTRPVVIVRSAQQRVAVHVDEVLGNQEVVVKNLGPQLSRLPGLAGMTLLASGTVALIYNPVALATLYGGEARSAMQARSAGATEHAPLQPRAPTAADEARAAPLVLVVDDSLTVRRVTQRLLVREGYRVTLAKDGLDAIDRLADEIPQVVLSDIEMPRMDGFDLVRNLRSDPRWRDLPVIMITSRIAEKHREHARELGVDHYLGKPYSEDELLALIGRYCGVEAADAQT